jgi:hypothetical protein
MKRNISAVRGKHLLMLGLLMFLCLASDAQFYYGPPPPQRRPPPSRRQQADNKNDSNPDPSGYLAINLGYTIPQGSFGTAFGSAYGAYATPGLTYDFSFAYPICHSNFGFALMYGNYTNGYDLDTYVNNLNNSNPNLLYQSVYPDNDIYSESSLMGGLFITVPVGRFSFDARIMGGVLFCSLPEQDYATQDAQGNINQYDIESSTCSGFAFDAGLGIRYLIVKFSNRQLCAMVNLDYLYSNPNYSTVQDIYQTPALNNPNNTTYQISPSPPVSGHLPISLLNISLGLGYQFGDRR